MYVPLRAPPWIDAYDTATELAQGLGSARAAALERGYPLRVFVIEGRRVPIHVPDPTPQVIVPGVPAAPPPTVALTENWLVPPPLEIPEESIRPPAGPA